MNDFNEVWYSSADGLRLFARDYPFRDNPSRDYPNRGKEADPAGTVTVVCIPGLTRNSADFHGLGLHLQPRCRVIAVDLRGRGRSAYDSNPANYHPGTYVKDVLALFEALDLKKAVLVGTSLGGLVSMLIGASQPDRMQALVINDFGPELQKADLERIKSYVGKTEAVANWEEAVAQCKSINGKELPGLNEKQWLSFARNLYREDRDRILLDYDPAISEPFNQTDADPDPAPLWAAYDALPDVPVLVLRGALSELLAVSCVEEMQRRRERFTWVNVPGRGHAPLLNEPAALEAIDELLRSLQS